MTSSWYGGTDWPYRKKVSIIGTQISGNQTNFPVLYKISGISRNSLSNGTDIVFTGSGSNRISHDLISFSGYSGNAWVNISSMTNNHDTVFYMYYGNTGGGDQTAISGYKPSSTWNDYIFVCHMKDAATNQTLTDSSKYQLPLWKGDTGVASPNSPYMVKSFLGSGQQWGNLSNSYISSTRVSQFNNISSQLSIEIMVSGLNRAATYNYHIGWHNLPTDTNVRIVGLYTKIVDNWFLSLTSGTRFRDAAGQGGSTNYWPSTNFSPNTRVSIIGYTYWSGNVWSMYNAGKALDYDTSPSKYGNLSENNYGIIFGNRPALDYYYSGCILEARVTKRVLNRGWYLTSYINASSMAAKKNTVFYTIGETENAPAGATTTSFNVIKTYGTGWIQSFGSGIIRDY